MLIKVGMHVDGGETMEAIIDVDNNATNEEIEAEAKEWAWDYIDLWWEK